MRYINVSSLIAILMLTGAFTAAGQNWLIVPGQSVGPISRSTSEKELIKIFGARNVRRRAIDVGEGETEQGTIIFQNDPRRKASILWSDASRQRPKSISITNKNTLWKTDRGITIGTPLTMIEELTGRPFVLMGFGWDYSGTVIHSNGGRVGELGTLSGEEIVNRTLLLRLEPRFALQKTREFNDVNGEKEFFSNNPAMKKLNPRVYELTVEFSP